MGTSMKNASLLTAKSLVIDVPLLNIIVLSVSGVGLMTEQYRCEYPYNLYLRGLSLTCLAP